MPDHLSVSQVTTFLECPRRYRLKYIDRLVPAFKPVALAFGIAVHSTVAWFQEKRIAGELPSPEDVARTFRADWASELAEGDVRFERRDAHELEALGQRMLEAFVFEAGDLVPDGVDVEVMAPLFDPRNGEGLGKPLLGYLDALLGGVVIELKTAARKSSPAKWAFQLSLYAWAIEQEFGFRPSAKVIQLVKTKEPSVQIDAFEVLDEDINWALEVTAEVHRAIELGSFFPSPSWNCRRCEFRFACRAA